MLSSQAQLPVAPELYAKAGRDPMQDVKVSSTERATSRHPERREGPLLSESPVELLETRTDAIAIK